MRRFLLVSVSLAAVLALSACGSSGSTKASPPAATQKAQPATVTYPPAGPNPSFSAKMICQTEAVN